MMKLTYRLAAVLALLALVGFVQADDEKKCCGSAKCKAAAKAAAPGCGGAGCATAACDESKGCPLAAAAKADKKCPLEVAMGRLPKISFAVGKEKTGCPKTAGKLAKKSGAKVRYVVMETTFAKESDAKLALVEATEKYVGAFAKPKKCSVSGTITVANKKLGCEIKAAQTAKTLQAAMDNVKLTYVIGDKKCHCPIQAKAVAKKTGKSTLYVVGDQKTGCPVTARLNLAQAKYKAAVLALVRADAKANEQKAGAGS